MESNYSNPSIKEESSDNETEFVQPMPIVKSHNHHILVFLLGMLVGSLITSQYYTNQEFSKFLNENVNLILESSKSYWDELNLIIGSLNQPEFADSDDVTDLYSYVTDESTNSMEQIILREFPNQSRHFHASIKSCYLYSIINHGLPSIIILVSQPQKSNCVARKLIKILSGSENTSNLIINTTKFKNQNSESAKKNLDSELANIFDKLKERVALVEDIKNIPAESMLLFHAYGDDAGPKFNGIILFLTFEINEDIISEQPKKVTSFVEEKLTELWKNKIYYDQRMALFARITNNVVLVNNNEDNCR